MDLVSGDHLSPQQAAENTWLKGDPCGGSMGGVGAGAATSAMFDSDLVGAGGSSGGSGITPEGFLHSNMDGNANHMSNSGYYSPRAMVNYHRVSQGMAKNISLFVFLRKRIIN